MDKLYCSMGMPMQRLETACWKKLLRPFLASLVTTRVLEEVSFTHSFTSLNLDFVLWKPGLRWVRSCQLGDIFCIALWQRPWESSFKESTSQRLSTDTACIQIFCVVLSFEPCLQTYNFHQFSSIFTFSVRRKKP